MNSLIAKEKKEKMPKDLKKINSKQKQKMVLKLKREMHRQRTQTEMNKEKLQLEKLIQEIKSEKSELTEKLEVLSNRINQMEFEQNTSKTKMV